MGQRKISCILLLSLEKMRLLYSKGQNALLACWAGIACITMAGCEQLPASLGSLLRHMQTHNGCLDRHSDQKAKHTEPTHLRQRHPEPREERAPCLHHIVTQYSQLPCFPDPGGGLRAFQRACDSSARPCHCVSAQNKRSTALPDSK